MTGRTHRRGAPHLETICPEGGRRSYGRCPPLSLLYDKGGLLLAEKGEREEYTYKVDKITFIVTPVYKEGGETMRDILLKLMLADQEQDQRRKPA